MQKWKCLAGVKVKDDNMLGAHLVIGVHTLASLLSLAQVPGMHHAETEVPCAKNSEMYTQGSFFKTWGRSEYYKTKLQYRLHLLPRKLSFYFLPFWLISIISPPPPTPLQPLSDVCHQHWIRLSLEIWSFSHFEISHTNECPCVAEYLLLLLTCWLHNVALWYSILSNIKHLRVWILSK